MHASQFFFVFCDKVIGIGWFRILFKNCFEQCMNSVSKRSFHFYEKKSLISWDKPHIAKLRLKTNLYSDDKYIIWMALLVDCRTTVSNSCYYLYRFYWMSIIIIALVQYWNAQRIFESYVEISLLSVLRYYHILDADIDCHGSSHISFLFIVFFNSFRVYNISQVPQCLIHNFPQFSHSCFLVICFHHVFSLSLSSSTHIFTFFHKHITFLLEHNTLIAYFQREIPNRKLNHQVKL